MNLTNLRPAALLAAAILLSVAPGARAQSRESPNLAFSVTLGYLTSGQGVWNVGLQPLPVAASSDVDTVSLGRRMKPGFDIALGATLFLDPHLGYTAEVALLGISTEERCALAGSAWAFDSNHYHQQACTNAQGRSVPTNAASFQAGLLYRFRPGQTTQPYLRASGGLALLGGSYIQTLGQVVGPINPVDSTATIADYVLTDEGKHPEISWVATLGAGAILVASPGYQFRFEVRDVIIGLPVVTGPRTGTNLVPPTARRAFHIPAFSVAVDILLEQRRTRRY